MKRATFSHREISRRHGARPRVEALEGRLLLSAGDLDTTFGGTGVVSTDLRLMVGGARSILVQPADNKIVVSAINFQSSATKYGDFTLIRYNPNGSLDTSFGGTGIVTTDFSGGVDRISQLIFENTATGTKILAVGSATKTSGQGIALARYNMNGTLDTTFGSGGKVFTQIASKSSDSAAAVVLDPSGRIIVSGTSVQAKLGSSSFANVVLRYNANGTLDTTFGGTGKVVGTYGSYSYDTWTALEILGTGSSYKIGALGQDHGAGAIARFNTNGTRDTTFGSNGQVPNHGGSIFQPDGKIVGVSGGTALTVLRLNADGTPDASFGVNGQVVTPASTFYGGNPAFVDTGAVAVDASGRIVVAGRGRLDGSWFDSLVARYSASGSLDTSFGSNGAALTRVGGDLGGYDEIYTAVALQPDGKILAAGYHTTSVNANTGSATLGLNVVRYLGDNASLAASTTSVNVASKSAATSADLFLSPLALDSPGFVETLFSGKPRRAFRLGSSFSLV